MPFYTEHVPSTGIPAEQCLWIDLSNTKPIMTTTWRWNISDFAANLQIVLCLSIGSWGRARPRGRFQGNKGRLALSSVYAGPHRAWSRRTCARERIQCHSYIRGWESWKLSAHAFYSATRRSSAGPWHETMIWKSRQRSWILVQQLEMDNLDSRCNTAVIPIGAQAQQGKIHWISQIISPRTVSGNNVLVCVIIALRM